MLQRNISIFNTVVAAIGLLGCWGLADANILCGREFVTDSLGNRMYIGCDNGRLKSISICRIEYQNNPCSFYQVFVMKENESDDSTHHFGFSESYEVGNAKGFGFMFLTDTTLFRDGRDVFLQIYRTPRDTVLRLERLLTIDSTHIGFNTFNIKISESQKVKLFTSDSIKIPEFSINRKYTITYIHNVIITDFHCWLTEKEFVIQFNGTNIWTNEIEPYQYRFRY